MAWGSQLLHLSAPSLVKSQPLFQQLLVEARRFLVSLVSVVAQLERVQLCLASLLQQLHLNRLLLPFQRDLVCLGSRFQPVPLCTAGFGQPASSGSSLFGQSTSDAKSLFGQPSAGTSSIFGQAAPSSSGLFGQPSAAAPATGFGFGSQLSTPTTGASTGFGFGSGQSTGFGGQPSFGQSTFGQSSGRYVH